ncbi:MAG: hypothetical protein AAF570_27645, partial [Bacteroidota bacterium]
MLFLLFSYPFVQIIAQGYQIRYQDSLNLGQIYGDAKLPTSLVYDDSTLVTAVLDRRTLVVLNTDPNGDFRWQRAIEAIPGGFSPEVIGL